PWHPTSPWSPVALSPTRERGRATSLAGQPSPPRSRVGLTRRCHRTPRARYFAFASKYFFTRSVRVPASLQKATASLRRSSSSATPALRTTRRGGAYPPAAEACRPADVAGPFKGVPPDAVRRDAQPPADRPHVGELVERARRHQHLHALHLPQVLDQQLHLLV